MMSALWRSSSLSCDGVTGLPLAYGKPELTALVAPYGKVLECRVLHDAATKQPRGVGFARLDTHEGALQAIASLNGTQVTGSKLTIVCKVSSLILHHACYAICVTGDDLCARHGRIAVC